MLETATKRGVARVEATNEVPAVEHLAYGRPETLVPIV